MRRLLSYLWAAPATVPGLICSSLALAGGEIRIVDGVVEAHGPALRWALRRLVPLRGGAAAITLGHVVLAVSATALAETRAHERVHVCQYARWGPLFLPAYVIASAGAWCRGEHVYFGNRFEREAHSVPGNVPAHAPRAADAAARGRGASGSGA